MLIEAKEEAEAASRLKSSMLGNMSHEVRTPLTATCGFAEILGEELEGELGDFATRIKRSGDRLLETLDSILQFSKLEAGAYKLERKEVDLARLAKETVDMLRPKVEEKSIALKTNFPEGRVKRNWNTGALNRILENLQENAIRFFAEGGTVGVESQKGEGTRFTVRLPSDGPTENKNPPAVT